MDNKLNNKETEKFVCIVQHAHHIYLLYDYDITLYRTINHE